MSSNQNWYFWTQHQSAIWSNKIFLSERRRGRAAFFTRPILLFSFSFSFSVQTSHWRWLQRALQRPIRERALSLVEDMQTSHRQGPHGSSQLLPERPKGELPGGSLPRVPFLKTYKLGTGTGLKGSLHVDTSRATNRGAPR